jgi:hypothetical protein
MMAKGTFFHHTSCAGRDLRRKLALQTFGKRLSQGVAVVPVKIPGMIWTGSLAIPTSYAPSVDLAYNSRFVVDLGSRGGTDKDTRRAMLTVHTGPREIADLGLGEGLTIGDLVKLHPGDTAFLI